MAAEQAARKADRALEIVILGLSITSSWGNGHATTYRGLVRELVARGNDVLFLERDVPWYRDNADMPTPPWGRCALYRDLDELRREHDDAVKGADLVIVGSYVPDGIEVGEWVTETSSGVTAFYDIDTPITLEDLHRGRCDYVSSDLIGRYDLYLSFTGGPILTRLEEDFGARRPRPLYCSVDPEIYYPEAREIEWDLGYLGTYSDDRQPRLEELLLEPARRWPEGRFVVAGPKYPESINWPPNVGRIDHLPPPRHRGFYNAQRFTLNVTRDSMTEAGYAPSVRLFEAGACGVPVISDCWDGLEVFFAPGREILTASTAEEVLGYLGASSDEDADRIARRARRKVLRGHTAAHRAEEVERYWREVINPVAEERGYEVVNPTDQRWFPEGYIDLFDRTEAAMERLLTDDTPENRAKAYCHYHLVVESVLAQTGYYGFTSRFSEGQADIYDDDLES
ncbi:MAG: glycosyltransferase family protein, partial [Armatimonadota bacterium]